jgi:hypothetical protein
MSDSKQDIIQTALDLMGEEVTLHLKGDEAFGGVAVRFGTVSGVSSMGDTAHITVDYMRDSSGYVPDLHALVKVDEIIRIKRYGAS